MGLWRTGIIILALLANLHASVDPIGSDLQTAVPIAAIVVVAILSLIKMLAEAISDPRLDAWVKTEFREFGVALIIISFLILAVTGAVTSGDIGSILAGEEADGNYIDTSVEIVDNWLDNFDNAFEKLIDAGGLIRTASTYSPYISVPLWYVSLSYSSNPLAGTMLLLTPISMGAQALTNAIFLCEGLKLLILYCDVVVPAILLPGAFIIRLIPFTRKLGNTLISIAIAGYVLLPLSVIIVNELNKTIDVPEPEIDLSELDGNNYAMGFANSLCGSKVVRTLLALGDLPFAMISCVFLLFIPGGQGAYWPCVLTMWNVVYPIIQIVFQLLFTSLNIIWEATISTGEEKYWLSAFDAVIPFLESVNNLVFLAYIDLIMIATITIVGARSFSSALGGEVYMFGIQRLI